MSEQTKNHESEFIISRAFDAPRNLVWKAWTDRERLAQWWGPKDFELTVYKFEFKPEGEFHYGMKAHNGFEMWGKFIYKEIKPDEKLTYISSFADEKGNSVRAPFFDGKWPMEIFNEIKFTEENGKTTLHLRAYPIDAPAEEVEAFIGNFKSMQMGFGGTFDKLASVLSERK